MLKIFTTTKYEVNLYSSMFQGLATVDFIPDKLSDWPKTIDLIIFTGGEDINPILYGGRSVGRYNDDRDFKERNIFLNALRSKITVKKFLGICRGMQFLNVMLGGTLVNDIEDLFGKRHAPVHPIIWKKETVFTPILSKVNSMHHQAIYSLGDSEPGSILAIEPETGLPEIVLWRDRFLGFQFHPEYFGYAMEQTKFDIAKNIVNWINGESLYPEPKKAKIKKESALKYSIYDGTYNKTGDF